MAVSGCLWLSPPISGYLRLPLAISGYLWLSLAISGYSWLSLAIPGYLLLSLAISDYLYQVSNIRVQVEARESKLLLFLNFLPSSDKQPEAPAEAELLPYSHPPTGKVFKAE